MYLISISNFSFVVFTTFLMGNMGLCLFLSGSYAVQIFYMYFNNYIIKLLNCSCYFSSVNIVSLIEL